MLQQLRSCFVIASILLVIVPVSGNSVESADSSVHITSQLTDGMWVNESLEISGSTSLNPQTADWVLYDVTNPYVEWPIIKSGDYFTSVTPIDEGLWEWDLIIDIEGLNCTCWLEIGQPNGLSKEFLNRIIFAGSGPHNPVVSPLHSNTIMLQEAVEISAKATLSDSIASDGNLILSWCSSPNGACDGETYSQRVDANWSDDIARFTINASELELEDGIWTFTYLYQDAFLKKSPNVEMTIYVDRSPPISSMISPNESFEGDTIIIDGSGSNDGVWSNNLQYVWYVTKPDGTVYVPSTNTTNSMLNLVLNESGTHVIKLDVIDWVGRMNSTTTEIVVKNLDPVLGMEIDGIEVKNPTSWQFSLGSNVSLKPTIVDSGDNLDSISYSWYVDENLISNSREYSIAELEEGTYDLLLVVVDDDGASDSYEIEIIIKSQSDKSSDNQNHGAVVVLIGIIIFSVLMFGRIRDKKSVVKSLPKWNDKIDRNDSDSDDVQEIEDGLWD